MKRRRIHPDPTSDCTYQLIKTWLTRYDANHTCGQGQDEALLPTRVIDVGPSDGSREPYLLISDGGRGRYITLSYCWSTSSTVVATRDNLNDHKIMILILKLPKTIQDTIFVIRSLGIPFLWADVLCIIQDSAQGEDW